MLLRLANVLIAHPIKVVVVTIQQLLAEDNTVLLTENDEEITT